MFKGILCDIDNTLYDYEPAHLFAMSRVYDSIQNRFDTNDFQTAFKNAREDVHTSLKNTAASHNRLLYFQKTLELLKCKDLLLAKRLYDVYWNNFLDKITLFEGVTDFFETFKDLKICFVTDLTAYIQYRKLEKTGLAKYADNIVTSEEAGCEKPDKKVFITALEKSELRANEVCMLGDSLEKDVKGAIALGIKAFWLDYSTAPAPEGAVKFNNFKRLTEIIING